MTICIAAIAENNKIVAVTDKMLTLSQPLPTTFEVTDSNKVAKLANKTLALFAGDVVHANEILKRTKVKVQASKSENINILDIANMTNQAFKEHWEQVVSNYLMLRFQVNLKTFMENQGAFEVNLIKQVNETVSKFGIDVEILIAGIDSSPRIYLVNPSGTVLELSSLGYACIGSGSKHATLSLIESEYSASFNKAQSLYSLLEAKMRAEYDPGVGKHTDIAIVDGNFAQYNEEQVRSIIGLFEDSRKKINKQKHKYYDKMQELTDV